MLWDVNYFTWHVVSELFEIQCPSQGEVDVLKDARIDGFRKIVLAIAYLGIRYLAGFFCCGDEVEYLLSAVVYNQKMEVV